MKKAILSFVLLSAGISAYAQSDLAFVAVRYKLTHVSDTTWRENPNVTNHVLYIGKSLNWYTDFDREERIRQTGVPSGYLTVSNVLPGSGTPPPQPQAISAVQKDFLIQSNTVFSDASGKHTAMENAYGKLVAVTEDNNAIEWQILPDTKEIMGISCQKATGTCKGRTYEAWFSSQYPYSVGPWKLSGLPGLILEASDTKKEVVFSFVSFENLEQKKPIAIAESAIIVKQQDFKKYKQAILLDRQAMAGSSAAGGGGIVVAGTLSNLSPAGSNKERYRMFNNPIEKENKAN